MDKKLILVGLMGMNKDTINSKTAQQQAYEIKNFRLSATLDSNAFELTTERGTKSIPLYWRKDKDSPFFYVLGTIIGYCILNDYLVLFTKDALYDRIYRLTLSSNEFEEGITEIILLYEGDKLEFDTDHLIDAIPYYETELIQKVYWIDGKNLPRVINIANRENSNLPKQYLNNSVNYDPYGFVLEIYGDYNSILVTKGYVGGMFHAGVIQYAYSFFNENAQETPVIDVTPLYYIAHEDRGEKPDTRVGCTFTLTLNVPVDFHDKFDYIRFYSIYRSALDTTPLVKVINEVETSKLTTVYNTQGSIDYYELSFIDDNTLGYVYDALLLLIRNNKIIPLTFNYKDGKLFFGNFKNSITLDKLKTDFSKIGISFYLNKILDIQDTTRSSYNYINQLQNNSLQIKTFKGGEYYKFGILLLDKYGNWTFPYYIDTLLNNLYPKGVQNTDSCYDLYKLPIAISSDTIGQISNLLYSNNELKDYIRIRPLVSFPKASERTVLCLGIVNSTVFNLGQRVNHTCFAQSSWFFRPNPTNREGIGEPLYSKETPGLIYWIYGQGYPLWKHNYPLFNSNKGNGEMQHMYFDTESSIAGTLMTNDYDLTNTNWYEDNYSSNPNYNLNYPYYQQLTQLLIEGLNLLYSGNSFSYDNHTYQYYYNIGTFDSPEYEETENSIERTYFARIEEVPLQQGENTGKKYTVYKLKREEDLSLGTTSYTVSLEVTLFVSTTGELWYYTELDEEPDKRKRIPAHLIHSDEKSKYESFYYIDLQICTINSPEVECDLQVSNIDISNYDICLSGAARFTSTSGSYNIIAENPLFLNDVDINKGSGESYIRGTNLALGFIKKTFNMSNGMVVSALNCWIDDICNIFAKKDSGNFYAKDWNRMGLQYSYLVYPWQRRFLNNYNGNLMLIELRPSSSDDVSITTENATSGILRKILANLRYSYTEYISDFSNKKDLDADYIKIFDSEEPLLLKLSNDNIYSGNVDLLASCTSKYKGLTCIKVELNQGAIDHEWGYRGLVGYPLVIGTRDVIPYNNEHIGLHTEYTLLGETHYISPNDYVIYQDSPNNRSNDSIWIRYKSSPHFIFKIGNNDVLPFLETQELLYNHLQFNSFTGNTEWGDIQFNQPEKINLLNDFPLSSYLFVADICNNQSKFNMEQGDSFSTINRIWLPCGDSIELTTDGNNPNYNRKLEWSEGDTFFQRYDCLKTYPFSNDDYQSVVEIGSFMLETRVNLDGRYDTNRGLMDNTAITKENFNLINPVYSQMNNFFLYKILDDIFNNKETEYKNRITWTLDKQNGDDVDLWTRVTELRILDLDGDKGKVTKIERFDNNLYIFQDKGIARLNYNDNIQIPTEGSVPIEVVNSGFINGKRYISENQGLQDKWCSKSTPYGIFFKDEYSKALCTLKYDERRNPVVAPLSYGSMLKWTELNIDDIYRVNYDNQVNEVLFMLKNKYDGLYSLHYSPLYQVFTAFYDYKDWIANYNNSTISLLNDNSYYNITYPVLIQNIYFVRRHEIGEEPMFNYFYDGYKPYWIKWTSVIDGYDCIFNNIYYKGDLFNKEENSMNDNDIVNEDTYSNPVFNEISVSNDYQSYELEGSKVWKDFKPIKKFRIWRGAIPRLTINGKYMGSRIRNHWVRIGLRNNEPDEYKAIVRDLKVEAFF